MFARIGYSKSVDNVHVILAHFGANTAKQADKLHVTEATIKRWIKDKSLPGHLITRYNHEKSQAGFGLLEVMISVGIMSIVMLGMASQMNIGLAQQSTLDQKTALVALQQTVTQTAMDNTSCTAAATKKPQLIQTVIGTVLSIVGAKSNTTGQMRFDLPDGHVIAAGEKQADYLGLRVTGLNMSNSTLVAMGADGTKVYYGTLSMSVESTRPMLGPQQFAPRALGSIYMTVKPDGTVLKCGAQLPPEGSTLIAEAEKAAQAAKDAAEKAAKEAQELANKVACTVAGGSWSGGSCKFQSASNDDGGGCGDKGGGSSHGGGGGCG